MMRRLHGMIFLGGKNNIGLHRRHLALTEIHVLLLGRVIFLYTHSLVVQQSRVATTLQTPPKNTNRSLSSSVASPHNIETAWKKTKKKSNRPTLPVVSPFF